MKTNFNKVIFFLILVNPLISQQKDLWKTYTTADGLAGNWVNSIIESSDGSLWCGTSGGASQFSEGFWKSFTIKDGLINNEVHSVIESRDGSLWFGTSGGISQFKKNSWKTFTTKNGLIDIQVRTIIQSGDGAIWFGTYSGVSRLYEGNWTNYTAEENGLINNNVRVIFESSDSAIWFGTSGGVSRLKEGIWTSYTKVDGLVDNYVRTIIESSDGSIWFGTYGGLSRFKEGIWTNYTEANCLSSNLITACIKSSDGSLLFSTSRGIDKFDNNDWNIKEFEGLSNSEVHVILEKSDGSFWFGTSSGVSRFEEDVIITFTTDNGLVDNHINSILEGSDGSMWFGTYKGVSRFWQGSWINYSDKDDLAGNYVRVIIESSDRSLWFGTSKGISHLKEGLWETLTTEHGLVNNDVHSITEAKDGSLWFGTSGGVSRFKQGAWTNYTDKDKLVDNYVRVIIESSNGSLWFGTYNGVNCLEEGNWTTITSEDGLINNNVWDILESSDGSFWFCTSKGVSRFRHGVWTSYNEIAGLTGSIVREIIESDDGALWFGTYGGVSRFANGIWTSFTNENGLINIDIYAILEASDGIFWFGTAGGINWVKPDKFPPFTFINKGPQHLIGNSVPMFIYSGKDYRTKDDQLYYSFAVVDSSITPNNNDWSNFSRITSIQTQALLNGTYKFYVRAIDAWGNIDPTPATRIFTIDVTPPSVIINYPKAQDIVSGNIAIIGSAFDSSPIRDFKNYQLSYAYGTDRVNITKWLTDRFPCIKSSEIRDDTLAIWNTEGLVNGNYWLRLSAFDTLGHESHDYVNIHVVKACDLIDARNGSYLSTVSGEIDIYIPPNAITKDLQINIEDCQIQDIDLIDDPKITFANLCFRITPDELLLYKPGTLTLIYPDSVIQDKNEQKLALYRSTDGKDDWQRLGGTVGLHENKITTSFSQSGVFALYEDFTVSGKAGIFSVNSQPRIFSPQGGGYNTRTGISFELGKESDVTIKIYNAASRLIRVLKENESMPRGSNVVYWDGRDKLDRFCVGGLYIVTIQVGDKMATKTVAIVNKY